MGSEGGMGVTNLNQWATVVIPLTKWLQWFMGLLHSGSMGSGDLGCFHTLDSQGCRWISIDFALFADNFDRFRTISDQAEGSFEWKIPPSVPFEGFSQRE